MLTGLEAIINFYMKFYEAYGWTKQEVDNTDLCHLFDILIVQEKVTDKDNEVLGIDEVF